MQESGVKVDKLTLVNRQNDGPIRLGMTQAIADSIKQNLGIEVEVKDMPIKDFTADLLQKDADGNPSTTIDFGRIDYGMDYLDPSNMLSVFKGSELGWHGIPGTTRNSRTCWPRLVR